MVDDGSFVLVGVFDLPGVLTLVVNETGGVVLLVEELKDGRYCKLSDQLNIGAQNCHIQTSGHSSGRLMRRADPS
jgi:hypothetical protein